MATQPQPTSSIKSLSQNSSLWYHLHVFLYDLRHFESNNSSRERLELFHDPFYIGQPYFDAEEAEILKRFRVTSEKDLETVIADHLSEKLNRRESKRLATGDHRVCAGHDIAPLLEKILEIRPKDVQNNKAFQKQLRKNGLQLPNDQTFEGPGGRGRSSAHK